MNSLFLQTQFNTSANRLPADFWLITAYNPDGIDSSQGLNESSDMALFAELENLGHAPIRITGSSPDGIHSEPGWAAPIDESTALELGRKYQQLALFHFHSGKIDLVDCTDSTRISLSNPEGRLKTL